MFVACELVCAGQWRHARSCPSNLHEYDNPFFAELQPSYNCIEIKLILLANLAFVDTSVMAIRVVKLTARSRPVPTK